MLVVASPANVVNGMDSLTHSVHASEREATQAAATWLLDTLVTQWGDEGTNPEEVAVVTDDMLPGESEELASMRALDLEERLQAELHSMTDAKLLAIVEAMAFHLDDDMTKIEIEISPVILSLPETVPAQTQTYTAFCEQDNGHGTTWIQGVTVDRQDSVAAEMDAARTEALRQCAVDWHGDEDDTHDTTCVGLIKGDADIVMWDDAHRGEG